MATEKIIDRARGLGIISLVFGVLGAAFYWWTPLGMVLSLTGLVMGFVGSWGVTRRPRFNGLSIAGLIVSAVAFAFDLWIALQGLETVQLMPYR